MSPYGVLRLAPKLLPGEALSSWLARTAEAHRLTLHEVQSELGVWAGALDRGEERALELVASATGHPVARLLAAVHPALRSTPRSDGPAASRSWTVCQTCLRQDHSAGMPPHVRAGWTHPLSTMCLSHRAPLVPHTQSAIQIAHSALEDDHTISWRKEVTVDHYLERLDEIDVDALAATAQLVARSSIDRSALKRLALWTQCVGDVVDALWSQSHDGSVMSHFEWRLRGRRAEPGSLQLDDGWIWRAVSAYRLLYVRTALIILAEPPDPLQRPGALGSGWLADYNAHSRGRDWRSRFEHAVEDPLILLAIRLPAAHLRAFQGRTLSWPKHLRRRWTYVTAVAAMAGYG